MLVGALVFVSYSLNVDSASARERPRPASRRNMNWHFYNCRCTPRPLSPYVPRRRLASWKYTNAIVMKNARQPLAGKSEKGFPSGRSFYICCAIGGFWGFNRNDRGEKTKSDGLAVYRKKRWLKRDKRLVRRKGVVRFQRSHLDGCAQDFHYRIITNSVRVLKCRRFV